MCGGVLAHLDGVVRECLLEEVTFHFSDEPRFLRDTGPSPLSDWSVPRCVEVCQCQIPKPSLPPRAGARKPEEAFGEALGGRVRKPEAALHNSCDWTLFCVERGGDRFVPRGLADCGRAIGTHRPRPPGFTAHPQRHGGPCATRQPNLASYIQS